MTNTIRSCWAFWWWRRLCSDLLIKHSIVPANLHSTHWTVAIHISHNPLSVSSKIFGNCFNSLIIVKLKQILPETTSVTLPTVDINNEYRIDDESNSTQMWRHNVVIVSNEYLIFTWEQWWDKIKKRFDSIAILINLIQVLGLQHSIDPDWYWGMSQDSLALYLITKSAILILFSFTFSTKSFSCAHTLPRYKTKQLPR